VTPKATKAEPASIHVYDECTAVKDDVKCVGKAGHSGRHVGHNPSLRESRIWARVPGDSQPPTE
jgi:hypothetical protein